MSRLEAVHIAARLAVERWMSEGDRKAGEELVAALKRLAGQDGGVRNLSQFGKVAILGKLLHRPVNVRRARVTVRNIGA